MLTCLALTTACGGSDEPSASASSDDCAGKIDDASAAIQAAAKKSEGLGLDFIATHKDIVRCAKKIGGTMAVQSADTDPSLYIKAFNEKYPGIKVKADNFDDADSRQRFMISVDSGAPTTYDVGYAPPESYKQFADLMKSFDVYGMAEAGVLDIPIKMVDPKERTIVATASTVISYAYNPELIDESEIPTTWEGFTDPKFSKGEKGMALALTFQNEAVMAAFDGIDKTKELVAGLAANKPLYVKRYTDGLQHVVNGEVAIMPFANLHSATRILDEDPDAPLKTGLISPVLVRTSDTYGVFNEQISKNPYAALLWIEWLCSPEAQELKNADGAPQGSIYVDPVAKEFLAGHEVQELSFADLAKVAEWENELIGAAGFPNGAEGS